MLSTGLPMMLSAVRLVNQSSSEGNAGPPRPSEDMLSDARCAMYGGGLASSGACDTSRLNGGTTRGSLVRYETESGGGRACGFVELCGDLSEFGELCGDFSAVTSALPMQPLTLSAIIIPAVRLNRIMKPPP